MRGSGLGCFRNRDLRTSERSVEHILEDRSLTPDDLDDVTGDLVVKEFVLEFRGVVAFFLELVKVSAGQKIFKIPEFIMGLNGPSVMLWPVSRDNFKSQVRLQFVPQEHHVVVLADDVEAETFVLCPVMLETTKAVNCNMLMHGSWNEQ